MVARQLILFARRSSGMSQRELAVAAGVKQPTLSAYENGHRQPTVRTVERLLRECGLRLDLSQR